MRQRGASSEQVAKHARPQEEGQPEAEEEEAEKEGEEPITRQALLHGWTSA